MSSENTHEADMHICVVAAYWPTKDNPTSGLAVKQQLDAFLELGHTVSLVLPGSAETGYSLLGGYSGVEGFRVFYSRCRQLPMHPFPAMTFPLNMKTAGEELLKQVRSADLYSHVDVVMIHEVAYTLGLAEPLAEELAIPCFLTIHEQHPTIRRLSQSNGFAEMTRKSFERVGTTVLTGESLGFYADDLGVRGDRRVVIPGGTFEAEPDQEEVRTLRIEGAPKRVILSVSDLTADSGLDDVARALGALAGRNDWLWRIIGEGPERGALAALVKQLKIADRVRFVGAVTRDIEAAHYAAADVFVLPGRRSGLGGFISALRHGNPVLGCFGSDHERLVQDGVNGYLVRPGDVAAISARTVGWLDDVQGLAAQSRIAASSGADLSWAANAAKHIELFRVAVERQQFAS